MKIKRGFLPKLGLYINNERPLDENRKKLAKHFWMAMHFVFVVVGRTSGKAAVRTLVNNFVIGLFFVFLKGIS